MEWDVDIEMLVPCTLLQLTEYAELANFNASRDKTTLNTSVFYQSLPIIIGNWKFFRERFLAIIETLFLASSRSLAFDEFVVKQLLGCKIVLYGKPIHLCIANKGEMLHLLAALRTTVSEIFSCK